MNMVEIRDTLIKAQTALTCCTWEDGTNADGVRALLAEIDSAAKSLNARNCDVGTVEEQSVRYDEFCEAHRYQCLGKCPLYAKKDCKFARAQMPYEAKEGGAE